MGFLKPEFVLVAVVTFLVMISATPALAASRQIQDYCSKQAMAKYSLIALLIGGLVGDKALADCTAWRDTPASVIEYFHKFDKP
jgi:hypothetical protein